MKIGDWWLKRDAIEDIASGLGLAVVPIVYRGPLHSACVIVSGGMSSAWGQFQAEGMVLTPEVPLFARNGHRIITKIKTRDYRHE